MISRMTYAIALPMECQQRRRRGKGCGIGSRGRASNPVSRVVSPVRRNPVAAAAWV
jgi:hypothetical protein